jgi:3-hydroxyacyl-[acyl-carrier-protein] dehydratase
MQLDIEKIKELIPQRFPFIMIDKILEIEPGKHAIALKNVSMNEEFFQGHFPGTPVMPGALILEAMAQTAIVLFAFGKEDREPGKKPIYYFGSAKARFLHPVVPGDRLKIKVVNVKALPTGAYISGEAMVEDRKVSEAELTFSVKND